MNHLIPTHKHTHSPHPVSVPHTAGGTSKPEHTAFDTCTGSKYPLNLHGKGRFLWKIVMEDFLYMTAIKFTLIQTKQSNHGGRINANTLLILHF